MFYETLQVLGVPSLTLSFSVDKEGNVTVDADFEPFAEEKEARSVLALMGEESLTELEFRLYEALSVSTKSFVELVEALCGEEESSGLAERLLGNE